MNGREPRAVAPTSASADAAVRRSPASESSETGADAYAYNPELSMHEQRGLDRLRCIEDRELAAVLYRIYVLTERNRSRSRSRAGTVPATTTGSGTIGVHLLGARALAGELGFAAQELATNLLIDETGRELADERSLGEFARAFRKLPRPR